MTVKEAAAQVDVAPAMIYLWCAEQRLVHYRFGGQGRRGRIRIAEKDLLAFIEGLKCVPAAPKSEGAEPERRRPQEEDPKHLSI